MASKISNGESPIVVAALDFSKLSMEDDNNNEFPIQIHYQKLLNYSLDSPKRATELDNVYDCIFCNFPSSPRSTVAIINKKWVTPRRNTDIGTGLQIKKCVQYSCVNCAEKIKSSIKIDKMDEDKDFKRVAPAPAFTPRDKSDKKASWYADKFELQDDEFSEDDRKMSERNDVAEKVKNSVMLNKSSPSSLRRSSNLSLSSNKLSSDEEK